MIGEELSGPDAMTSLSMARCRLRPSGSIFISANMSITFSFLSVSASLKGRNFSFDCLLQKLKIAAMPSTSSALLVSSVLVGLVVLMTVAADNDIYGNRELKTLNGGEENVNRISYRRIIFS